MFDFGRSRGGVRGKHVVTHMVIHVVTYVRAAQWALRRQTRPKPVYSGAVNLLLGNAGFGHRGRHAIRSQTVIVLSGDVECRSAGAAIEATIANRLEGMS